MREISALEVLARQGLLREAYRRGLITQAQLTRLMERRP